MLTDIKNFLLGGNLFANLEQLLVNVSLAILIFVVGRWLGLQLLTMLDRIMKLRKVDEALRGFVGHVLTQLMHVIVILIAIDQLGIDTTSLLALLGAAGLAVGLALKDSLSNFAAGVMLILFKPFKVGDAIDAGGESGVVEGISIVSTIIRSGDNKEIIVPNAKIYSGIIVNASRRPTRRVDITLTIAYGSHIPQAKDLISRVLLADSRILPEPAPVIAVNELSEAGIQLVIRPWVVNSDYWSVKWDCLENIKLAFDTAAIQFAPAQARK